MSPAGDRGTTDPGPSGLELLGLGVLLAVAVVLPLLVGIALDANTDRGPLFSLVGLFVGIATAVAVTYKRLRRYL
jgi:F0F1-type ATP synthase assembly protein I